MLCLHNTHANSCGVYIIAVTMSVYTSGDIKLHTPLSKQLFLFPSTAPQGSLSQCPYHLRKWETHTALIYLYVYHLNSYTSCSVYQSVSQMHNLGSIHVLNAILNAEVVYRSREWEQCKQYLARPKSKWETLVLTARQWDQCTHHAVSTQLR